MVKKILSLTLVLVIIASMFPFAMAEDEVVEVPQPAAPVTETATFEYTQGENTITQEITVTVTDPSTGNDTPDDVIIVEKEISETVEDKGGNSVIQETNDLSIVTDEEIVVQETTTDKVVTVADETETAIEGGDETCAHNWVTAEPITYTPCHWCNVYTCDLCGAIKYEEITKEHTADCGTVVSIVDCAGYTVYKCNDCGETFTLYDISATKNHTYEDGVCTKCGDVKSTSGTITNSNGDKPTYSFENNTLTVSGKGEIPDYKVEISNVDGETVDVPAVEATPWQKFADKILKLIIGEDITRIGDFAFADLFNLKTVDILGKKTEIGDYAFAEDEKLTNVNFKNKSAEVSYDNEEAVVSYIEDGEEAYDEGATSFANDGTVSVNFRCNNTKADDQEKLDLAIVKVTHNDLHLNCTTVYGYEPTEKEFGKSNGQYCNDCKKIVTPQYKIYPNGKPENAKYIITDFKNLKETPESIINTKYNTFDKLPELINEFKTNLNEEYKKKFNSELSDYNFKVFDIKLADPNVTVKEDSYIVNIPYPSGLYLTEDYIVVQFDENGNFEKVDTFLTNKGIQIELETLSPVGVCWKLK